MLVYVALAIAIHFTFVCFGRAFRKQPVSAFSIFLMSGSIASTLYLFLN